MKQAIMLAVVGLALGLAPVSASATQCCLSPACQCTQATCCTKNQCPCAGDCCDKGPCRCQNDCACMNGKR